MASNTYDVIDISNYLIKIANDKHEVITNLKLQKLLYFLQAAFLIEQDKQLIEQKFQRWDYGPVIPDSYHFFKQFGSGPIGQPVPKTVIDTSNGFKIKSIPFNEDVINENDRNSISNFYDKMGGYSTSRLIDMTHEQSIWKKYSEDGSIASHSAPEYEINEIKEEFVNSNKNEIWK